MLILRNEVFGWVVTGTAPIQTHVTLRNLAKVHIPEDKGLKKFWELEDIKPSELFVSEEEQACELLFKENTYRTENGQFVVKFHLKRSPSVLGEPPGIAIKRFISLERKFQDQTFKQLYTEFIHEYESLGHMKWISNKFNDNQFDHLKYKLIDFHMHNPITKRYILSAIAQIYDSLGLLSPTIIFCKIMIQSSGHYILLGIQVFLLRLEGNRFSFKMISVKFLEVLYLVTIQQLTFIVSVIHQKMHMLLAFIFSSVNNLGEYTVNLLCTKAVCIEIISDLTTDNFLCYLRRFVSQRRVPHSIYSDNQSAFQLYQRFWSQFSKHNIPQLHQQCKRRSLQCKAVVGSVVLIKNDQQPPPVNGPLEESSSCFPYEMGFPELPVSRLLKDLLHVLLDYLITLMKNKFASATKLMDKPSFYNKSKISLKGASAELFQKSVAGSVCQESFYHGCITMTSSEARLISSKKSVIWTCDECAKLGNDIISLKAATVALQKALIATSSVTHTTATAKIEYEEVVQEDNRIQAEKTDVLNILTFVSPSLTSVSDIRREGKFDSRRTHSRPVKVTFGTSDQVLEIISCNILKNFMEVSDLEQYNNIRNTNDRLLDFTLSNINCHVQRDSSPLVKFSVAAHTIHNFRSNRDLRMFNFRKANFSLMFHLVSQISWNNMIECADVNDAIEQLEEI
nr:unnamed protein product [Callosobruchus chinensis]